MLDMYDGIRLGWLTQYARNNVTFHCLLEEFIKTKQKLDTVSDILYEIDEELLTPIFMEEE